MPENAHNIISDVMDEMELASRRNSLFCSSHIEIAELWGNLYVLFVEDGWSGTVFNNCKDNYSWHPLSTAFKNANQKYKGYDNINHYVKPDMKKAIIDLKPEKIQSSSSLSKIIDERYADVLITGEIFYGIDPRSDLARAVFNELGLAVLKK